MENKKSSIIQSSLDEVLHNSMMPYAEHVILDRALPRVEDGLKPVQRRILYTMYEMGLTPDKPHRKCAKIVGDCLGKYHPHGDTSVYDALVRMAQDFNMRMPLVNGHGNFGTVDGDSAAAYRYTEARLEELALVFGSQGEAALSSVYPGLHAAQISNFVGFALDTAAELGYRRLLLAGHPGKLSKVAAGVMQTHSHYADARREAIMAHLALIGAPVELVRSVHDSATTDAAMRAIADSGYDGVWKIMADSASAYCEARVRGACEVDVLFIDGSGTPLGMSARMREDENRWKNS